MAPKHGKSKRKGTTKDYEGKEYHKNVKGKSAIDQDVLNQKIAKVQLRIQNERNKSSECRALADLMYDTATLFGSVVKALYAIPTGKRDEAVYKAQSVRICEQREVIRTKLDAFERENDPGRFYCSTIENYKRLLKLIDCVNDMILHGDIGGIEQTYPQLQTAAEQLDYMAEAFSQNTMTLNNLHQKALNQGQSNLKEGGKELARIKKDVNTIQKKPPGGDRMRICENKLKTVFNPTYNLWKKKYKPKTGFKGFLSMRRGKDRKLDDTFSELGQVGAPRHGSGGSSDWNLDFHF